MQRPASAARDGPDVRLRTRTPDNPDIGIGRCHCRTSEGWRGCDLDGQPRSSDDATSPLAPRTQPPRISTTGKHASRAPLLEEVAHLSRKTLKVVLLALRSGGWYWSAGPDTPTGTSSPWWADGWSRRSGSTRRPAAAIPDAG